jgi:hypothetical protein
MLRPDGERAGEQSLAEQAKHMSEQSCHVSLSLCYSVEFAFFVRI